MSLSSEEKRRIYAEELMRVEARQRAEAMLKPPTSKAVATAPASPSPTKRKASGWVVALAVFVALVIFVRVVGFVVNRSTPVVQAGPTAVASAIPVAMSRPPLPPEPAPPVADLASEVPGLEAKLAEDHALAAVWTGPRADLDLFLTWVSELLATSAASTEITTPLAAKHLHDAGVNLFFVFTRKGAFPAPFTEQLARHLAATKNEPHLGVWSPWTKGARIHDYAALAAWLNREDPAYFREHIAAKAAGPIPWGFAGKEPPPRPYLVNEIDALNWLALLTRLSPEESARRAALVEQAKQPRLGQDFRLGDFTYNVKGVTTYSAIGNGYAEKQATAGARFVVVEYTMRNDAGATKTVLSDDFRIVDSEGRSFRPSSDGNTALAMSGKKDLIVSELQPGIARPMATAFELPDAAASGTITLVIPEKGMLGTGSVRITLK